MKNFSIDQRIFKSENDNFLNLLKESNLKNIELIEGLKKKIIKENNVFLSNCDQITCKLGYLIETNDQNEKNLSKKNPNKEILRDSIINLESKFEKLLRKMENSN